jgi:hypothetical protein
VAAAPTAMNAVPTPTTARNGAWAGRIATIGLMAALSLPAPAVEWFGRAYRHRVEFGVMSRTFAKEDPATAPRRYVLLHVASAGSVLNPRGVSVPEDDLKAAAHAALRAAGFEPAMRAADAELAIVVTYAKGEYPPPFEFMGIDPLTMPSFRWPPLLKQYDQQFFRRDYATAPFTGFLEGLPVDETGLVNFIGVRAFDAHDLREHRRWTLRWETRVTIDALHRPLPDFMGSMLLAAAESFGRDNRNGFIAAAPVRDGVVEIGALRLVGYGSDDGPAGTTAAVEPETPGNARDDTTEPPPR